MKPIGTWVRSSSRAAYVHHPDGRPLPRARGLQTLELHQDGVAKVVRPGRDDRAGAVTGSWSQSGDGSVEVALPDQVRTYTLVDDDTSAARLVPETPPAAASTTGTAGAGNG